MAGISVSESWVTAHEFARTAQGARCTVVAAAPPKGRYGRSASLKWPWLYDKLRAKGYDKEKAARISNSRLRFRKKGRLNVLKAGQAHNPKVLKRVAEADRSGKHLTGKQLTRRVSLSWVNAQEFACHTKACAPPPVGKGGSTQIGSRKAVQGLAQPDSGFTLSTKLAPLRSGFAVALSGSDRLVLSDTAFTNGKPSPQLVSLVRERISAAIGTTPPKGTKVGVGGWHNPADGKIEINVTVVFPKTQQAKAVEFAKQQDQIAIFGLHNGDLIMTGGTGGERVTAAG